jgi:hypothetical protein
MKYKRAQPIATRQSHLTMQSSVCDAVDHQGQAGTGFSAHNAFAAVHTSYIGTAKLQSLLTMQTSVCAAMDHRMLKTQELQRHLTSCSVSVCGAMDHQGQAGIGSPSHIASAAVRTTNIGTANTSHLSACLSAAQWTIKAKLVRKAPPRSFNSRAGTPSRVFNVELADAAVSCFAHNLRIQ